MRKKIEYYEKRSFFLKNFEQRKLKEKDIGEKNSATCCSALVFIFFKKNSEDEGYSLIKNMKVSRRCRT